MNIAFDGIAIFGPGSQDRGIGNYTVSQLAEMVKMDQENQYYIFNLMEHEKGLADYFAPEIAEQIHLIDYYCGRNHFLTRNPEYAELIGNLVSSFIHDYAIDVFYITTPFDGNMMPYRREWFGDARVLATVYDIIPYIMPENFFTGATAELAKQRYVRRVEVLRGLDQVLAISQCVKDDLIRCFEFREEQLQVIYAGVDAEYQQMDFSAEEKEALFQKLRMEMPYILCTGGKDPRKNLDGLIQGYSKVKPEVRDNYQLVIVGKLPEELEAKYVELARSFGIENQVRFTGFVTKEELVMLNNLAELCVFPSKYEGFGLPVVEAWACGTPVLTSKNSSLAEIAEGASILVDPFDAEDIARGINQAMLETDLEQLTELGRKRLDRFSWKRVAEKTLKQIQKACQGETEEACFSAKKQMKKGCAAVTVSEGGGSVKELLRQIARQEIYLGQYSEEEILMLTRTLAIACHKE